MRSALRTRPSRVRTWLVAGVLFASAGCWSGKEVIAPTVNIGDVITQVAVENTSIVGVLSTEAMGAPAGGPAATVDVQSPAVLGGSVRIIVSPPTPFQQVTLGAGEGVVGHYVVSLPAPVTSVALIVTVSQSFNFSPIPAMFGLGGSGGTLGDPTVASINVLRVGTGEVQISTAWNSPADVDLYVVDPNGEEIYYGHTSAASGGVLDLDSNAGCGGEDKRNENTTWDFGTAPRGTYTVRLNYYSACSAGQTNWVVTVRTQGSNPVTFTGTFTGPGVGGGAGAGELVTTFTY